MKSHITVIINSKENSIESVLKDQLEIFRMVDDGNEMTKKYYWDYWVYYSEEDNGDAEIRQKFPTEAEEVLCNSFYVRNLPNDYMTSGVIDSEGIWKDIQDFGWQLLKEPSKENNTAFKSWQKALKEILNKNQDNICVQILVHS